jgi:hypothetical protein
MIASCAVLSRCLAPGSGRARLMSGRHLNLYVAYEDVIPKTSKVLTAGAVHRVVGGLRGNGELIFRGTGALPFAPGSVIVAAQSAALPYGLLRKVSRVTRKQG